MSALCSGCRYPPSLLPRFTVRTLTLLLHAMGERGEEGTTTVASMLYCLTLDPKPSQAGATTGKKELAYTVRSEMRHRKAYAKAMRTLFSSGWTPRPIRSSERARDPTKTPTSQHKPPSTHPSFLPGEIVERREEKSEQ